jgi:hypothetical protein
VVRARTVQRRQKSKGRTERTKKTRAEAPCKRLAAANGAINSAGTDTRCYPHAQRGVFTAYRVGHYNVLNGMPSETARERLALYIRPEIPCEAQRFVANAVVEFFE